MKRKLINIFSLFFIGFMFRLFLYYLDIYTYDFSEFMFIIFYSLSYENIQYDGLSFKFSNSRNLLRESAQNSKVGFSDKCKCKIHWIFLEKCTKNFTSYDDFKLNWNPNTSIKKVFLNKIMTEYNEEMYKWKVRKRTIKWFMNIRK